MSPQDAATRSFTTDRSPASNAVDGVFRRLLKISDPSDADQVAKGLLARYTDEAEQIKREQAGLPFSVYSAVPVAPVSNGSAVRPEAKSATDALDAALTLLTADPDLSDIEPELRGWATTIRRAAADGLASARFAIDATERDRAFAARRTISDYACLARYAGAATQCATDTYCRVAQACDDTANVILVVTGDVIGETRISRSSAILQVPAATLQVRRDNVIAALRGLLQPGPLADQDSEPRASLAAHEIYDRLAAAGAVDLRTILDEQYLARQLDDLVDLAAGATPDGLRALGSAATVIVRKLQRFHRIVTDPVDQMGRPNANRALPPPARAFLAEIELFAQGFDRGRVGYRLPYLARSPLLVSSFAASEGIDQPTGTLLALALERSALADAVDCLCCSCEDADAEELLGAAKVLFLYDRVIDLYGLGDNINGRGSAEMRARIYAYFVGFLIGSLSRPPEIITPNSLRTILGLAVGPVPRRMFRQLRHLDYLDNQRWIDIVSAIAPLCRRDLLRQ